MNSTETPNRSEVLEREKAFHNRIFEKDYDENERSVVVKYYASTRSSEEFLRDTVRRYISSKKVLEYGCGPGDWTLKTLADGAAFVTGIDLSDTAIAKARQKAQEQGASDTTEYFVMDAENLTFEPHSFDVCYGNGIIHHLDTSQAYRQIAKILRADGVAVFREPLGMNPLINLYRSMTPKLRTPDEHPFVMRDIELARESFREVSVEFFTFLALATTPFRNLSVFPRILALAERIDSWLFTHIQWTRRFAWMAVITLKHPKI